METINYVSYLNKLEFAQSIGKLSFIEQLINNLVTEIYNDIIKTIEAENPLKIILQLDVL
jgi:hypothetical protein